jgi:hypothetical protein
MKTRCDEFDVQPIFPSGGLVRMTESDFEDQCVTPFAGSVRRPYLMQNFRIWLTAIRKIGIKGEIWLDGSFLTKRPEPDDLDFTVAIDPTNTNIQPADVQAADLLLDRVQMKQMYGLEVYYFIKGSALNPEKYWLNWFGTCRDDKTPKGIAEVVL